MRALIRALPKASRRASSSSAPRTPLAEESGEIAFEKEHPKFVSTLTGKAKALMKTYSEFHAKRSSSGTRTRAPRAHHEQLRLLKQECEELRRVLLMFAKRHGASVRFASARCWKIPPALVDLLSFNLTQIAALKLLFMLSTNGDFCAALRNARALQEVRGLVFLSPSARSGGSGSPHELRCIVYYSLSLLVNLVASAEDGAALAHSGLERLNELARGPNDPERMRWAGPAICEVAQVCVRNVERLQTLGMPAPAQPRMEEARASHLEQWVRVEEPENLDPPAAEQNAAAAEERLRQVAAEARRLAAYSRPVVVPTHTRGFHDFGTALEVLTELPAYTFSRPHGEGGGDNMCTICLEEFIEGEQLRALPCCHQFHAECVEAWVEAKAVAGRPVVECRCPNCNQSIHQMPASATA